MKATWFAALLTVLTSVDLAASPQSSEAAYGSLKSLEGTWVKDDDSGKDFRIVFELTANESVLVESWMRGDRRHSMTVYHLDGDRLMATHYCPQGNQPRMVSASFEQANVVEFHYQDATNLVDMSHSHQHSLRLDFSADNGSLVRGESYLGDGVEDHSELLLVRNVHD